MILRGSVVLASLLLGSPAMAQSTHSAFSTGLKSASMMTTAEIKDHNKALSNKDANYIRCRKFDEIGSLVRKTRVCKTNAQWTTSFKNGNQDARDTMDAMSRSSTNYPN